MTAVPPARISHPETGEVADPRVEALVNEVIGRVADKWTMLILEVLAELENQYEGVTFTKIFSSVDETRASFHATQNVLLEGMGLAALVVFVFLRNWRSTAIAAFAMGDPGTPMTHQDSSESDELRSGLTNILPNGDIVPGTLNSLLNGPRPSSP